MLQELLYRNFVVAAVKTFFVNPVYRMLTMLPLFFIFLQHDRSAKCFKNKALNMLQTASTGCLILIVICNFMFSFSLYMANIQTIISMQEVLTLLSFIEGLVYLVPPIMIPLIILRRSYRERPVKRRRRVRR